MNAFRCGGLWLLGSLMALAAPLHAQEAAEEEASFSVDAAVGLVSDYRFRGYSLSDKDPAIQPELAVSHTSGIYAYVFGSTLAENDGADIETDVGIGYATALGPLDADFSAVWYLYPGAANLDFVEFLASFSTAAGPATLGAEFAYSPPQANIGGIANRYAGVNGSLPLGASPVSLSGTFGIEDGAFGDNKLDWSLGLAMEAAGFEFGANYVDAASTGRDPLADPTVVVSVRRSF